MDDASLVRDCLSGSEKACKALFDRYAPSMLAMCVRYSSSRPEAEDNLQEGFIKIFQNLEHPPGHLEYLSHQDSNFAKRKIEHPG